MSPMTKHVHAPCTLDATQNRCLRLQVNVVEQHFCWCAKWTQEWILLKKDVRWEQQQHCSHKWWRSSCRHATLFTRYHHRAMAHTMHFRKLSTRDKFPAHLQFGRFTKSGLYLHNFRKGYVYRHFPNTHMFGWLGVSSRTKVFLLEKYVYHKPFCGENCQLNLFAGKNTSWVTTKRNGTTGLRQTDTEKQGKTRTLLYLTMRFVSTSPQPTHIDFDSFKFFASNIGEINLVLGKKWFQWQTVRVARRLPSTQQFDKDTFASVIRLRFGGF